MRSWKQEAHQILGLRHSDSVTLPTVNLHAFKCNQSDWVKVARVSSGYVKVVRWPHILWCSVICVHSLGACAKAVGYNCSLRHFTTSKCILQCALLIFSPTSNQFAEITVCCWPIKFATGTTSRNGLAQIDRPVIVIVAAHRRRQKSMGDHHSGGVCLSSIHRSHPFRLRKSEQFCWCDVVVHAIGPKRPKGFGLLLPSMPSTIWKSAVVHWNICVWMLFSRPGFPMAK